MKIPQDRPHQKEENELRWDPSRLILFLEENEQYGDDWSEEIKELKKL